MTPHRSAVNLVLGASGSGKTRLIESLLEGRPNAERWAVLMNDISASGAAAIPLREGVDVRQTAGCACCTGQLVLRTTLVSVLRAGRPARVLIEASAAAEPKALLMLLRDPELASALQLRAVLATVSTQHLLDARYLSAPVYRAQLASADVVVINTEETANEERRAAARAVLHDIVSDRTRVMEGEGAVELSTLDIANFPSP
jgi:G3E family GTPase